MCGIAGFFDLQGSTGREEGEFLARRMADQIAHRGPDDSGVWSEAKAGIFLAHRRLSILDLSPAGHQPMASAAGRYTVVFNGEIYNHAELRKELEGARRDVRWRGHSDTEVMLAAFEQWGIRPALERFTGMYAIALWDRQDRELVLIRDRAGEKPLYWACAGNVVLFGSELKALRAHREFAAEVDRNSLTLLLRHDYIPAPRSIYQGVEKIQPGTLVRFRAGGAPRVPECYWSAHEVAAAARREPWRGNDAEAAAELERLIGQSVTLQLVADVPVGAFLSGGIDSSAVVAIAQARSGQPVRTFTIGFDDSSYDEAQYALAVARHLGTDHTELYVSPQEAMSVIPRLPQIYDEPLGDSSQIPVFLVAQLARTHVKVSLSGDAGDELFAGYTRYSMGQKLARTISALPAYVRNLLASRIEAVHPGSWDRIAGLLLPFAPRRLRYANIGDKAHKFAGMMRKDPADIYLDLLSRWKSPARVVLGASEPQDFPDWTNAQQTFDSFVERGAWLDFVTYLPDDILVKVDRAAMAVSLESRIPLLDHRVIRFAWGLPLHMKLRNGTGKWLLRQVLYRHVPRELVDRPKMGFSIPLGAWLRGPLRDWAETLLAEHRLSREGFLDARLVREKWHEHLAGARNWHDWLWNVLMFQAWLEAQERP